MYLNNHADIKQAFSKLLGLTIDPKSAELRRTSQQIVVALFDLNAATFSMVCRTLPINLRESSDRIVRSHLQNSPDDSPSSSPVVGISTKSKVCRIIIMHQMQCLSVSDHNYLLASQNRQRVYCNI